MEKKICCFVLALLLLDFSFVMADTAVSLKKKDNKSLFFEGIDSTLDKSKPVKKSVDSTLNKNKKPILNKAAQGKLSNLQILQKKIEILQKQVKILYDEKQARKKLVITDDEKSKKEKELLTAAGKKYSLAAKNTLVMEYDFSYSYYSNDILKFEPVDVKHEYEHVINNIVSAEYSVFDNLTLTGTIPFVYKYDKVGTTSSSKVSDVGDISLSLKYQPVKTVSDMVTPILFGGISLDTGKSPYEINLEEELSTGAGSSSAFLGVSLSSVIDPAVVFGSLSYSYNDNARGLNQKISEDKILESVEPGGEISVSSGFGLSFSYFMSINLKYQLIYRFSSKYNYKDGTTDTGSATSTSILNIGTGWRVYNKYSLYVDLGIGLTPDAPDFTIFVRLPYAFSSF